MSLQWQIDVYKTAPHEAARRMINCTVDMDNFEEWLHEVYLCTNTAIIEAGMIGNPDLALPPEDSLAKIFIDIMSDGELLALRDWMQRIAKLQ